MPKSKVLKRKAKAVALQASMKQNLQKITYKALPIPGNTTTNFHDLVDADDLQIAIDTLELLAQRPSLIKSKQCKDLRTAVYEFRQASTTGLNSQSTTLTARVSAALADGKYLEARILLAEMRIRKETPKLGALCRWVRDLDVTSGLSSPKSPSDLNISDVAETEHRRELWLVLDAVLRTTEEAEEGRIPADTSKVKESVPRPGSTSSMAVQKTWETRDSGKIYEPIYQSVLSGDLQASYPVLKENFRIIETTPGDLRKPPNTHPAILYTSKDNAIDLSGDVPPVTRLQHPKVKNLSILQNVLQPSECASIISAAETIGFTPDAPIREEGAESSILAHNFYWITDTAFIDKLWGRVKDCVPEEVGGRKARGLNRRFRVYRYIPGAEYRCHIDGAWPPSSVDPQTDTYIYDSSPATQRQSSLFTFLLYLNDDFTGGETTFFLPSREECQIDAFPVSPVQGSVALFPHGDACGSLLHEGTGVKEGAKYIIRTDVEFDVDADRGDGEKRGV